MNAKQTQTVTIKVPRQRQRVQIFAFIWAGITLIFGAGTFVSVYAATGIVSNHTSNTLNTRDFALAGAAAMQITATPIPTFPPDQITPAGAVVAPVQPTVAVTIVPAGPTPTIPPLQDSAFDLGIAVQKNADPNVYQVWANEVKDSLKLNWAKSQVVWRDTEKAKGQYDWAELDTSVRLMSESNIKMLLSVTKAPDWARDAGAQIVPGAHDGPPVNPQDYADFLTVMLTRYKGKVHAVEVWNEVNLDREWSTAPKAISAVRYTALLKAAYTAIRTVDPTIVIVTAGLAPTGANIPGVATDDFIYMDQLIAAGALQYADCVGAHHNGINVPPDAADWRNIPERNPPAKYRGPWNNPNHSWSLRATFDGYVQRIRTAGSSLKLCVTEFGWPSMEGLKGQPKADFSFAYDNTLTDQANFIDTAVGFMQSSGNFRLAFIWNLNYGAQAGWTVEPNNPTSDNVLWSILGPNFARFPVYEKIAARNFRGQVRTPAQ